MRYAQIVKEEEEEEEEAKTTTVTYRLKAADVFSSDAVQIYLIHERNEEKGGLPRLG